MTLPYPLRSMLAGGLALAVAGWAGAEPAPAERPNILWITSEDNGPFLGCYGDKVARTPHLDRLAARGVRFTNAFANSPVCAPARCSLITGVPASSLGTEHMRSKYRLPDSIPTYAAALRRAGYHTSNNVKTDYNTSSFDGKIWDECGRQASYKNRAPRQPFFAVFNIGTSHESQIFDKWYPDRYPEAKPGGPDLPIPPYQVSTPENLRDWRRMYDRLRDTDKAVGKLLKELEQSGEADNTIVFYFSDHGGITLRSKRYLYDSGTRVPLIVHVPEKWRKWSAGEPGSASARLVDFLDLPKTVLAAAGAEIPPTMTGKVFLGDKAEPAPAHIFLFSGRFDAPEMRRGLTDGRWKYIRNYEPDRPRFQMIDFPLQQQGQRSQWEEFAAGRTTPEQSAFFQPQPPEELYDTQSDPHEIDNLANRGEHAAQLAGMRAALDRHLLATRDLGFIPEPLREQIDRAGGETIHEWGQSDGNYPLAEILPLANRASARDAQNIPVLVEALGNPNPIVRAWGALGLRVLGPEARPAEEELRRAMEDPDDSTRLTAIVAYGRLGKAEREKALPMLVGEAKKAGSDLPALWALDGLRFLDAPEAVEGLKEQDAVKGPYSDRAFRQLRAGGSTFRPATNPTGPAGDLDES